MALVPSTMMPLGTVAPEFSLLDTVSGDQVALADKRSAHANLVMFICNHCPYVKHLESALAQLGDDYLPKGVTILAISANDAVKYPDDGPEAMKAKAASAGYGFPYLYDETQAVARAYGAVCTPDFFVFDGALKCVYRGQFDDARPGNGTPVNGRDLRAALDALLAGTPVDSNQTPSIGCNIKWKS